MYAFLTGFGAGLALAVLFAPKSGRDARGYIGSKASDSVGYVKKQTGEAKETALDMMDRGKDAMLRQVERLATMQAPGVEMYHR